MTTHLSPSSGHDPDQAIEGWLHTFPPEASLVVLIMDTPNGAAGERVQGVLDTLPLTVPVLVAKSGAAGAEAGRESQRTPPNVWRLLQPGADLATIANHAAGWAGSRDLVLLRSDTQLPPDWLPRLHAAAYARSTIATATPLGSNGYVLPPGLSVMQADARVQQVAQRFYPIILVPEDSCVYIRRTALDVVGAFDALLSRALADFAQRAIMHGFCHVVADDLFVCSTRPPMVRAEQRDQSKRNGELVARYPWLDSWQTQSATAEQTPLARAQDLARMALAGRRIAIDATMLAATGTGMRVVILELIHALATRPDRNAHLTVILGEHASADYLLGAEREVDAVVNIASLRRVRAPIFDLVHRPAQVHFPDDFLFLRRIARRVVVTQLDFIMYANPSYFPTVGEWAAHRQIIEEAHAFAEGIAYLSADARQEATYQGLRVPSERTCVMYAGVDHPLMSQQTTSQAAVTRPSSIPVPDGSPFLLLLGNNFRHKNRVYATRLFKELAATYGWPGHLVLAGPTIPFGGSEDDEEREANRDGRFATRIHRLGAVSDTEKRWLLRNAALVLYPSIVEGFGLVPFEAAALGTPALVARGTSVAELLGDEVRYLETYDPRVGAQIAWNLLADPGASARQVLAIQAQATHFTWARVADILGAFYDRTLALPTRQSVGGYAPEGVGTLADIRRYARVVFSAQLNPHVPRPVQLLQRSVVMLRGEGPAAFLHRLVRWVRGERRYHRSPSH